MKKGVDEIQIIAEATHMKTQLSLNKIKDMGYTQKQKELLSRIEKSENGRAVVEVGKFEFFTIKTIHSLKDRGEINATRVGGKSFMVSKTDQS